MDYQTTFHFHDRQYTADLQSGVSIARWPAITDQAFDVGDTSVQRTAFHQTGFVGDVAAGGPCNVDVLQINPHCSTTHTETLLHIVDRTQWPLEQTSIVNVATPIITPCLLLHCEPTNGDQATHRGQTYRPNLHPNDLVVSSDAITTSLNSLGIGLDEIRTPFAIIVKTASGSRWTFDSTAPVPYFSQQAMALIAASRCQHLLVDFPSVDRRDDQGLLINHRQFWNVPGDREAGFNSLSDFGGLNDSNDLDKSNDPNDAANAPDCESVPQRFNRDRTITELVDVPAELTAGVYLLDLQMVPLNTDATLSRPVLFPTTA